MPPTQYKHLAKGPCQSVSIIIATKNEENNIGTCMLSIQQQFFPEDLLEIIVVDNNSSDRTRDIAQKYTDKVFIKGPERSAQRNYGMMEIATGKHVMYIDADMVLSPHLIRTCVETINAKQCLALHIPEIVLGNKFFSKVRRFERCFYDGTVIDGARFFHKDAFIRAGGFDETMSGPEDWDIDKKIKQLGQIGLVSGIPSPKLQIDSWALSDFIKMRGVIPERHGSVIYHNEAEFDLGNYLAKKNYYSKSFQAYISKWGANDLDVKRQLGIFYRYFEVFFNKGRWKRLISHPMLTLGMYFLRILVGLKFIFKK